MMNDHMLEFHRNAVARLPSHDDRHPGVAFYVQGKPSQQFCTCQQSARQTCPHLKTLIKALAPDGAADISLTLEARFKASLWYDLATVLSRGDRLTPESTTLRVVKNGDLSTLKVVAADGASVITYGSVVGDRNRLAERLGAFSSHDDNTVPDRSEVIYRMQLLTMTDGERQLHDLNMKSRRQALEGSLWFRLAYHCFMEFGPDACRLYPSVNEKTGAFMVTCRSLDETFIFNISVARERVRPLLTCLQQHLPNQHDLPIHPIPLKSLFRVSRKTETDLDVLPVIQLIQAEGEARFFSREGLEKFIYGDIVYISELKILAELEKPGKSRQFATPRRMIFKRYQIPGFLETVGDELEGEEFIIDPDVKGLKLLRKWDTLTLAPAAIDRDWCWLAINYGFGDETVSLAEILEARRAGTRYIGTAAGWVDTRSPEIENLTALSGGLSPERFSSDGPVVKLSRQELFLLNALEETPPAVSGNDECASKLSRLLTLEPTALPDNPGLASTLRDYQKIGLKWLWWTVGESSRWPAVR